MRTILAILLFMLLVGCGYVDQEVVVYYDGAGCYTVALGGTFSMVECFKTYKEAKMWGDEWKLSYEKRYQHKKAWKEVKE